MGRIFTEEALILDSLLNRASAPVDSKDYKCAKVTIIATGDFNGLVKFYGTDHEGRPDFSLPASESNVYSPIAVVDYDSGNNIAGENGVQFVAGPVDIKYNTLAGGPFTIGETITGGTSGATAEVVFDDGASILTVTNVTDVFQVGETITGGTSHATAKVTIVEAFTAKIKTYEIQSNGNAKFGVAYTNAGLGSMKVYTKLYDDASE